MVTQEQMHDVMATMNERFRPDQAEGVNATIQFELTGDAGGEYWLKVNDGASAWGEGTAESSDMTFKSSADDFYKLINGDLNPMTAFMTGKIKVSDVSLGMKMIGMFDMS